jgi:hypothetical protein
MGVPAIHPFKIVEQRPVEIAAHRDALADGSMEPGQVFQHLRPVPTSLLLSR